MRALYSPLSGLCRKGLGRASLRLRNFLRKNEDGATAIEFAILVAPFMACVSFTLMIGYVFLAGVTLEEGVREAGREIRVGHVASSNMSKNDFKIFICDYVSLPKSDCLANMIIDIDSAPAISGLPNDHPMTGGALDAAKADYDPGDSAEYVMVKAYLPVRKFEGIFGLLGSSSSKYFTVSSVTAFRNEPF